jgi:single-strand DNA-binding protein
MLNRIILQGRFGTEPELRQTPSGADVATVNMAVDRDFKDKTTGEKETDWITVVAWRNTAKFLSQYFTKGSLAVVEGRLQMRKYTDRDGNKRIAAEVVADNVYFGGSKKDSGNSTPDYSASDAALDEAEDQFSELSDDNGELPF